MKLHILSDLHLEHAHHAPSLSAAEADVVLLAGDIATGTRALSWAASAYPDQPVLMVPGNHEFYGYDMATWHERAAKAQQAYPSVQMLQCLSVLLADTPGKPPVRVLGATLWTDFDLYPQMPHAIAGPRVAAALNDFRAITHQGKLLRWEEVRNIHMTQLAWLRSQAEQANERGEKLVVMTHHAPSLKSSSAQYVTDVVSAGFASNLEDFARRHVDLWVHGHMHNSSDYQLGHCRVVANPRGYPRRNKSSFTSPFENPRFDPDLIVEI